MTQLFRSRDTLRAARLGLSVNPEPKCNVCGYTQDPDDMGAAHEHYGDICSHCDEGLIECVQCGKRRTEGDMRRLGDNPVCSALCDINLEYDNTNADNRLTRVDLGL